VDHCVFPAQPDGITPMFDVASTGRAEIVALLARYGGHVDGVVGDPRQGEHSHWTPLVVSCWRGFPAAARVLLQLGANVNYTAVRVSPLSSR
jgi:ankyrin repeat protein